MKDETSESLHEISAQPGPTCPLIDEALREVAKCLSVLRGYERAEEDELRDKLSDIESRLSTLSGWGNSGLLEDIRARTIAIRQWGQEWKDLAICYAPAPETTSTPALAPTPAPHLNLALSSV